jgi:hypothetical protein
MMADGATNVRANTGCEEDSNSANTARNMINWRDKNIDFLVIVVFTSSVDMGIIIDCLHVVKKGAGRMARPLGLPWSQREAQ